MVSTPFRANTRFGTARFGSDDTWRLVCTGNNLDGTRGDADGVSCANKYAAQDADTSGVDQHLHMDECMERAYRMSSWTSDVVL
jgi:hypothetical protein